MWGPGGLWDRNPVGILIHVGFGGVGGNHPAGDTHPWGIYECVASDPVWDAVGAADVPQMCRRPMK